MDLSEEMKKMIDVVKQYDFALKRNRYKSYIAPDIPDKIIKKLLKNFDSHMHIMMIPHLKRQPGEQFLLVMAFISRTLYVNQYIFNIVILSNVRLQTRV